MLLEEITPAVMVLQTQLVEDTCQEVGLSFIDLLTPFCTFNNIDVPVRTASDQPYRIKEFRLRLFNASDIGQVAAEVARKRLKEIITHASDKEIPNLCVEPPHIQTVLTTTQSELLPSWFPVFNKELVHRVSFSDHEAFDHLVACLVVVSSKDEDPIKRSTDLFNSDKLPLLLINGVMDPKILKYYLVLHDNQDGPSEQATKLLSDMRRAFGSADCGLICVNSSTGESIRPDENPWTLYKPESSSSQDFSCLLNSDDITELQNVMHDLSSKHIIPYMEQKVRILNQQVAATRKGFRNQIKNLWWRKGKDEIPDNPSGPMYTYNSIESQIRVLGDYAFMLRDYELALSNYRLLSTDYKLDKAWKRYAGVQEIMGLTYFMLGQSRKDAEYCMEHAFSTYSRMGLSGQQNATRCGVLWAEMLKTWDKFKEAAVVYSRISGEEPLYAAVMLEQASYCYLFAKPPMLRKYGFHLVLCGELYKKSDQMHQAVRTFKAALTVFKGTKWSRIRDHIHFYIGKWYASLGMFDIAVEHMLEVLACCHQSKMTQEFFLSEFFQIVQNTSKIYDVSKLQLPVIHATSLKVFFEDHRTYASPEAAGIKESIWRSLEEEMIPPLPTFRSNWLESQPKLISEKYKTSNVCVAGEPIKVEIRLENPLQIPISISGVSLVCEHSAGPGEIHVDVNSFIAENENGDQFRKSTTIGSQGSSFSVSEVDISFGGGQKLVVPLVVTPILEGTLQIVGVRWKLSGLVGGLFKFETSLVKAKATKKRAKTKQTEGNNLEFVIIKSSPKLEGFIRHLPKSIYAGDLRSLDLVLRNSSEIPLKNLKMKINYPRFLSIGNKEVEDVDFPACLEKKTGSLGHDKGAEETNITTDAVFTFPQDAVIHGETLFCWPLWLRAAIRGNTSLYITIYYEMGDTSTMMRYRTLRMLYNMEVLPSLDVSFHISPCPSSLQEFLVRMDVFNMTSNKTFQLLQLSSLGSEGDVSLLQPIKTICPSELLLAGQALSCFFKIKHPMIVKDGEASVAPLDGSDVRLSSSSSSAAMFDIHRSPFVNFYYCERLYQGKASQDVPNTVDFILISTTAESETNPKLPHSLNFFSYYTCHCSTSSQSPIWWLMEGPHAVNHNFSASVCEVKLKLIIHNSSETVTLVRIESSDLTSVSRTSGHPGNDIGWHDISLVNDIKTSSNVVRNKQEQEQVSSFIWSGASSTETTLKPKSTTEIPLQICVFSPGTYDLSSYILHWSLLKSRDEGVNTRPSSGKCQGHPYYLMVLQSS